MRSAIRGFDDSMKRWRRGRARGRADRDARLGPSVPSSRSGAAFHGLLLALRGIARATRARPPRARAAARRGARSELRRARRRELRRAAPQTRDLLRDEPEVGRRGAARHRPAPRRRVPGHRRAAVRDRRGARARRRRGRAPGAVPGRRPEAVDLRLAQRRPRRLRGVRRATCSPAGGGARTPLSVNFRSVPAVLDEVDAGARGR